MANFTVTTSVLRSKAEELTQFNTRFNQSIEKLVTSESNLNAMWDGEANDTFHAAFMTDKGKMDEFSKLIMQYIDRLQTIAQRYDQTEQTNTEIASTRSY